MSEVKRCPKCDFPMEEGKGIGDVEYILLYRKKRSTGERIVPFLCPRCGYIELYKKTKKRRNNP
jgi:predicted RNA-binding Zn-ribbon protein involved in translation (DUF1610 family)